jgi:hypothetical protein
MPDHRSLPSALRLSLNAEEKCMGNARKKKTIASQNLQGNKELQNRVVDEIIWNGGAVRRFRTA